MRTMRRAVYSKRAAAEAMHELLHLSAQGKEGRVVRGLRRTVRDRRAQHEEGALRFVSG